MWKLFFSITCAIAACVSEREPKGMFRELFPEDGKPGNTDRINGPYEASHNEVKEKSPCAVVVMSNDQNYNNLHSLLRRYRYDANGVLKPESVQYYYRMPRDSADGSRQLVPLDRKAFTPHGGFIRYYKEIAPIAPSIL